MNVKKIFLFALVLIFTFCPACLYAQVQDDLEIHKIIGGLYSVGAVANLENNFNSGNSINKYFTKNPNNIKFSNLNKSIWIGVPVNKDSSARKYLRANSAKLFIYESPDSNLSWFGEDYAWINLNEISNKLKVAKSSNTNKIFFSIDNINWWLAYPDINSKYFDAVIKKFGTNNKPDLKIPTSIAKKDLYKIKTSEPIKPKDIKMTSKKSSFDMSVGIGDVMFNPIPNVKY